MDGQEEGATYKNLMALDQIPKAESATLGARLDNSGVKGESRGSRRSVVFSKIKNPG